MSFTDGKPRVATEADCKGRWSGGLNGKHFRCGFCGHKFKVGDYWRFQFTNDLPRAGGNPLVCESCDEGPEKTRQKWVKKCKAFYDSGEWWWFSKYE